MVKIIVCLILRLGSWIKAQVLAASGKHTSEIQHEHTTGVSLEARNWRKLPHATLSEFTVPLTATYFV